MGIEVQHDSPEVGGNLQDHLDFTICRASNQPDLIGMVPSVIPQIIRAIKPYKSGTGMLTSNGSPANSAIPEILKPWRSSRYVGSQVMQK